jgi:lambda family phage tail tape measure protein
MATDLAELGIKVDSSDLQSGADALRNYAAVAKRTGQTVEEVQRKFEAAAAARRKANQDVPTDSQKQTQYSAATNKVIQSLSLQEARLTMNGRNFAIYSNQVKAGVSATSDAGQKIALATGKLYDMEQAQKQLKAANDNSTSSVDRFATRFTRGLIAGVAIQGVRELVQYLFQLNSALAAVGDSSKRIGVSTGAFQQLQAVAGFKGISSTDLASGAQQLAANLNVGVKYSNDLSRLFAANNLSLKDSAGNAKNLVDVLANVADLVRNARTEQDKFRILQEAGIPATSQWLRLLEQGGVAFKMALDDARRSGVETSDDLIRKAQEFDDKWNEGTTKLSLYLRAFFAEAIDGFSRLTDSTGFKLYLKFLELVAKSSPVGMAVRLGQSIYGLFTGGNSPSTTPQPNQTSKQYTPQNRLSDSFKLVDDSNKRVADAQSTKLSQDQIRDNQLAQQKLALLGPLITAQQAQEQVQLQVNAAAQNGVHISDTQVAALKQVALAQFEVNRVNQQAQIGVFDLATAQKAANDNLQSMVAQHLLDPNNPAQWAAATIAAAKGTQSLADAAKVAGSNLPQLQQALNDASNVNKQIDQFASTSFNNITTGLADIFDGTKSAAQGFSDLGKTVLRSLEEMLVKMYIVLPIFNSLKGILGGGSLLSVFGISAPVASAMGNVFPPNDNGISKYSNQIVSKPTLFAFANGVGLMGEAGDEAIMPLTRGPNGKLGVQAVGGGQSAGKTEIHIHGAPKPSNVQVQETVDGRGNRRIDVQLDDAVSAALARSGSRTQRTLANNYGAKPVGVRR